MVYMLNSGHIPQYHKVGRLNMLSKTDRTQVTLDEIRPIIILPHILKVLEKAIKLKAESLKSPIFTVGDYQTGFKEGHST